MPDHFPSFRTYRILDWVFFAVVIAVVVGVVVIDVRRIQQLVEKPTAPAVVTTTETTPRLLDTQAKQAIVQRINKQIGTTTQDYGQLKQAGYTTIMHSASSTALSNTEKQQIWQRIQSQQH